MALPRPVSVPAGLPLRRSPGGGAPAIDRAQLTEDLLRLEMTETRQITLDAGRYQQAARVLKRTLAHELSGLPLQAFVNPLLPALQTTAENVYFASRGRFADLDHSGHAQLAQAVAEAVLRRLRRR